MLEEKTASVDLTKFVVQKISEREAARKAKDYVKAYAIREELRKKGVELQDTANGVVWKLA